MSRSGVFIGVNRVGNLPVLQDAAAAATRMADWANGSAKFDRVELLTDDAGGRVTANDIFRKLRDVTRNGADQVIVYFAGHGIAKGQQEYWLLSDAPDNSNEAVNLDGTVFLARKGAAGHVVFISDACRTLPQDSQMAAIGGSEVFPNDPVGGAEKAVDQLFATRLGDPAFELKDRTDAAGKYTALYTEALLDALGGKASIGESVNEGGTAVRLIRAFDLREHLGTELTRRLTAAGRAHELVQEPDGRIVAHKLSSWLARVPDGVPGAVDVGGMAPSLLSPAELTGRLVTAAVAAAPPVPGPVTTRGPQLAGVSLLEQTTRDANAPSSRDHFESRCGLSVLGSRIREVRMAPGAAHPEQLSAEVARFWDVPVGGQSTLIVLEDGAGILLPALPNFVATVFVEDARVVDVAYEPAANTDRWSDYQSNAPALRRLRAVISFSTRNGLFRLDGEQEAESLAQRMQYAKGVDPSLAVYAAYAYEDLGMRDRISQMADYMASDFEAILFDVACLSGRLDGPDRILSPFPLLQQGWPSLRARGVSLSAALAGVETTIRPAVWTMFEPDGVVTLTNAMNNGAFR